MLVALAMLVSGCSDPAKTRGAAGPEVAEEAFDDFGLEATKTTGVIRGVVFDEAIRPVPEASVFTTATSGELLNATTTEAGLFGFDGLEPGTYFLQISKPGFLAAQHSVDVEAGVEEPGITKVLLQVDPQDRPRFEEFVYDAFIACSFTSPSVSVAACGLPGVNTTTNNRFLVEYNPTVLPTLIQTEAVWKSTNPFGGSLSLSITDFRGAQVTVNQSSGVSPIFVRVNESRAMQAAYGKDNPIVIRLFSTTADGTDVLNEQIIHDAWANSVYGPYNSTPVAGVMRGLGSSNPFAPECIKYPALFNACLRWGGVGIVINQQVKVYSHIFYGYTPGDEWQFSKNGAPPQPP